ncbi:hypothetical protein M5Y21_07940 [Neisseria meningitidis]|nr:hypothetical protein [Neisseria meningitidis]
MPSEARPGQSGALRRSFAISLAQAGWTKCLFYSGLNLTQYGVASPCPDLNLIHYI